MHLRASFTRCEFTGTVILLCRCAVKLVVLAPCMMRCYEVGRSEKMLAFFSSFSPKQLSVIPAHWKFAILFDRTSVGNQCRGTQERAQREVIEFVF